MPQHATTYEGLWLCSLTPEQNARTCRYWYTVTTPYSTPHTAFRTREECLTWLADRGLALTADLPQAGEHSCQRIEGTYRQAMHIGERDKNDPNHMRLVGGYDAFFALDGKRIRTWSNGQITLGIITTDADGLRTVHTLNPNMRDRPVYERE